MVVVEAGNGGGYVIGFKDIQSGDLRHWVATTTSPKLRRPMTSSGARAAGDTDVDWRK